MKSATCDVCEVRVGLCDDAEAGGVVVAAGAHAFELQAALHVGVPEGPGQRKDAAHPPGPPHIPHQGHLGVGVLVLYPQPLLLAAAMAPDPLKGYAGAHLRHMLQGLHLQQQGVGQAHAAARRSPFRPYLSGAVLHRT